MGKKDKTMNKPFAKQKTQVSNKEMERYSASFIVGEIQKQTTMIYYYTLTR